MSIPSTPPSLIATHSYELTDPGVIVSDLPVPVFNNTIEQQVTRIYRRSRGLKAQSFRAPYWYKFALHTLQFQHVEEATKDSFLTFIKTYLGLPINIITHNDEEFIGYIQEMPSVQEHFDDTCTYIINLNIEVPL
jgi:hypothetical protein